MNISKSLVSATMLLAITGIATTARGETWQHVDSLANQVAARSRDVCFEMTRFHHHQPAFQVTYRQAWELWSVSSHIHELLHNGSNQARIQRNTADLRDMLIAIKADVARWEATGLICTFNLKRKLAGLEEAIAHLETDVGIVRTAAPITTALPAAGQGNPVLPAASQVNPFIPAAAPAANGQPLTVSALQALNSPM